MINCQFNSLLCLLLFVKNTVSAKYSAYVQYFTLVMYICAFPGNDKDIDEVKGDCDYHSLCFLNCYTLFLWQYVYELCTFA